MHDPHVAISFKVPQELLDLDDEVCIPSCEYIHERLVPQLLKDGHVISESMKEGVWKGEGMELVSSLDGDEFLFLIYSFPIYKDRGSLESIGDIVVHYHRRPPFPEPACGVEPGHPVHATVAALRDQFESSVLLTQDEYDSPSCF